MAVMESATRRDGDELPLFTEENSEEVVVARMAECDDPRLRAIMESVIRHLHAVVKEVEPTQDEWMAAIRFLTATGHTCTDWRQEYILLSDILGVSMLVDAVNHRRPTGATENTVLGPFHVPGAPERSMGDNICLDGIGEPLYVSGTVVDEDGNPIGGALLDVWQANGEGFYDVQQQGIQPDMNLRGLFRTGPDGRFHFRSIKPCHYSIPHDGPVGKLLETLGRHPNRPAHIHFIVGAEGFEPATTHIFTDDDPYLRSDAVFGVKESLIGDFRQHDDPAQAAELGLKNPYWTVEWIFRLKRR